MSAAANRSKESRNGPQQSGYSCVIQTAAREKQVRVSKVRIDAQLTCRVAPGTSEQVLGAAVLARARGRFCREKAQKELLPILPGTGHQEGRQRGQSPRGEHSTRRWG